MEEGGGAVVVIGSINVDLIVGVPRLPAPGETVLGDRFTQQGGGKSANQAVAASRVGAAVSLIGAVGEDDLGRQALAGLRDAGVDVSRCHQLVGEHTGLALIVVDAAGENQIAVAAGANGRLDGALVAAALASVSPRQAGVCLVGFEVGDEAVIAASTWAAGHGWRIILNPAPARPVPPEVLACGPILTPNEREAAMMSGESEPASAARALSASTGAPVLVSLGARGALLWVDEEAEQLPATPVRPIDTTGAGDALNGILAAELARGADLRTALRWAMAGAALATTVPGAQAGLPSRGAIAARMAEG